jgi:hypothetical protein
MSKRIIEMVALEAASFAAEVKETVGASIAHARVLADIGEAAHEGIVELSAAADELELRAHAVKLRSAALHSLLCSAELAVGSARLQQLAAVREAARRED